MSSHARSATRLPRPPTNPHLRRSYLPSRAAKLPMPTPLLHHPSSSTLTLTPPSQSRHQRRLASQHGLGLLPPLPLPPALAPVLRPHVLFSWTERMMVLRVSQALASSRPLRACQGHLS